MDERKLKISDSHTRRKHKKTKKKHKKKHVSSSSGSSDSEKGKYEWVEAQYPAKPHLEQTREDWMNEEIYVPTFSKKDMLADKLDQKKNVSGSNIEKEIQRKRELNPYWKDNGSGLPEKETNVESLHLPVTSVGDGGYGWLKRAYRRIEEQAKKENRSMEDVAVERWGSLDKLVSMINEAESRMKKQSLSDVRVRHRFEEPDARPRKMRKPSDPLENDSWKSKSFHPSSKFMKPKTDDIDLTSTSNCGISKTNPIYFNEEKEQISAADKKHIPSWKKSKDRRNLSDKDHLNSRQDYFQSSSSTDKNVTNDSISKSHSGFSKDSNYVSSETSDITAPMTEEEMSKLSAKFLKAELMGNIELAEKLKAQLEKARKLSSSSKNLQNHSPKFQEQIVLSKVDSTGQSRPLYSQHKEEKEPSNLKNKGSKKKDYFEDSEYSLKQMFEREKLTTVDDNIEMYLNVSSQSKSTEDQDYDCDDVHKKFSKKMSHSLQAEKDIGKAISQHQRLNSAIERCEYCLDQPNMKKHLIINISSQTYLSLPPFQSVVEGHCLIVPKNHVSSCLFLDEDEWLDIKNLKDGLRKMFNLEGKTVLFVETSVNFRYCPHAIIECIPMPKETGDLAPLYFKKAIQESEREWSHNKKLIDLTNKGLQYSVPKGLPYFCVEFDPDIHRGYAHVIEDEKYFPRNFGKEVIGGMLDIDYNHLYKNRREDPLKKSKEVLTFEKQWKMCNPKL